jgi:hypothetical protein
VISVILALFCAYNLYLNRKLEKTMAADRAALDAKIQQLATRFDNVVADLKTVIVNLQAKIDQGSQPADFQIEVDMLQGVLDKANAVDPDNTNNETPVAPAS